MTRQQLFAMVNHHVMLVSYAINSDGAKVNPSIISGGEDPLTMSLPHPMIERLAVRGRTQTDGRR